MKMKNLKTKDKIKDNGKKLLQAKYINLYHELILINQCLIWQRLFPNYQKLPFSQKCFCGLI